MGLYKQKNSRSWWMSFVNEKGIRQRVSTGTGNRKLAEVIYGKVMAEVKEGKWFDRQKAQSVTFRDMAEKYLSKYEKLRDRYTMKRLLPKFGPLVLTEITTEIVSDYRDERLKAVKSATVYQELALMRRMFNVAQREWKWLRDNPVADLSFSVGNRNARDRWLTVEEEESLLSNASNPSWLRTLLFVALHTGMRKGEILRLKWQDVDFTRRVITIEKSKNGEKRGIPLSNMLHDVLRSVRVRDLSGRVFPISDRSLRAAFQKTLIKAGIKDFRIHDLRHTFATRLVQAGIDVYMVSKLLGHKGIAMTMRYAHHYPESLRTGISVLDSCHSLVIVGAKNV